MGDWRTLVLGNCWRGVNLTRGYWKKNWLFCFPIVLLLRQWDSEQSLCEVSGGEVSPQSTTAILAKISYLCIGLNWAQGVTMSCPTLAGRVWSPDDMFNSLQLLEIARLPWEHCAFPHTWLSLSELLAWITLLHSKKEFKMRMATAAAEDNETSIAKIYGGFVQLIYSVPGSTSSFSGWRRVTIFFISTFRLCHWNIIHTANIKVMQLTWSQKLTVISLQFRHAIWNRKKRNWNTLLNTPWVFRWSEFAMRLFQCSCDGIWRTDLKYAVS